MGELIERQLAALLERESGYADHPEPLYALFGTG